MKKRLPSSYLRFKYKDCEIDARGKDAVNAAILIATTLKHAGLFAIAFIVLTWLKEWL